MPPKKQGGGDGTEETGPSLEHVWSVYSRTVRELGIQQSDAVRNEVFRDAESEDETRELLPEALAFHGHIGPGGLHALAHGIVGVPISSVANAQAQGSALSLRTYSVLKHLNFANCGVENAGMLHLSNLLRPTMTPDMALESLTIQSDALGLEGIDTLCMALVVNTTLTTLKLEECPAIDDRAVSALSHGVILHPMLETLSLRGCRVGPTGCRHLSKLLRGAGNGVASLCLAENEITPEGLEELCDGLQHSLTLTSLDLRCCGLGVPMDPEGWAGPANLQSRTAFSKFFWAITDGRELQEGSRGASGGGGGPMLESLDLCENELHPRTAEKLDAIVNDPAKASTIKTLKVDLSLANYDRLWRVSEGKKGKKGGKKGKK